MDQPKKPPDRPRVVFVKTYKHYRTGKVMIASEYGYISWRFLSKNS
jgi:hypothetical protein